MERINISIIERSSIIQRGLWSLIAENFRHIAVHSTDTIAGLPLKDAEVDVVILDPQQIEVNYQELFNMILARYPSCVIIVYTPLPEEIYAIPFLKSGVRAFVSKSAKESEVLEALNTVFNNKIYATDMVKERLFNRLISQNETEQFSLLSYNEIVVANLLVKGHNIRAISTMMNVTSSTISACKARVLKKLKISNLLQLSEKMQAYFKI